MHSWKFFRTGELDQVSLETGADLLHLDELDQKLWVALSCPVKGLELDEKTLAMIDTDGDGRIRVPELIAAIKWAAARLKEPGDLLQGAAALPFSALNDTTPEGRNALFCAKQILVNVGKRGAVAISAADTADTVRFSPPARSTATGSSRPRPPRRPGHADLDQGYHHLFRRRRGPHGLGRRDLEKGGTFFTGLAPTPRGRSRARPGTSPCPATRPMPPSPRSTA